MNPRDPFVVQAAEHFSRRQEMVPSALTEIGAAFEDLQRERDAHRRAASYNARASQAEREKRRRITVAALALLENGKCGPCDCHGLASALRAEIEAADRLPGPTESTL